MELSNKPIVNPHSLYVYVGEGFVDAVGNHTPTARDVITADLIEKAKSSAARYCIVWGRKDCTYIMPDGTTRDGRHPPQGTLVVDDRELDQTPLQVEAVWTMPMPWFCDHEHICVRRIGDYIEITPGAPMQVANFCDGPLENGTDVTARFRDSQGRWKVPFVYRGVTVKEVQDDYLLLGPIQPLDIVPPIVLREPWPDQVEEACENLMGAQLPREIHDSIWRAIDPMTPAEAYTTFLRVA